ncbi:MAG: hypothetical protein JW388_1258 [Nitrospira sp.]|nr:hypothetical protein [Nitrospira sp.]
MRDVALVPEGDVLQRSDSIAANNSRKAGEPLPRDGVAFMRHGAGAFLAFGERFLGFENFGALQVTELNRPAFDARGDESERVHELSVVVALDHLRGDRRRAKAEVFTNGRFDFG